MATPSTLVDGLRATRTKFGSRAAITHQDRVLSYDDLWQRINSLATTLRSLGVHSGQRVALLVENSGEYVVGYYATLLAGGIAVGLNTASRAPELLRNLKHCEASVLLATPEHPELAALAANGCVPTIVLTAMRKTPLSTSSGCQVYAQTLQQVCAQASAELPWSLNPNDPASIIYTSGTTGEPKGVTLSHANLVANTQAVVAYLELSELDICVNVLPFFYSYGNSVLHTYLWVGASIVLENSLAYPHLVVERMAQVRATGFAGVPSTYALLMQRVNFSQYDLQSLRYLTQAGGAMKNELIARVRAALPQARLFVMYGQTEATARLTYLPPSMLDQKLGSVGLAVQGVQIEVRSESGQRVNPGTLGDVWAQGPNVMLGYWHDTHTPVLCDGWLKTGDIGYLDTDGFLYLQGRRSDMIKAGAHRIHPKEIEDVVAQLPGVAEVAVVGVDDEILGQAIKAVVVVAANATLSPLQVQAYCKQQLAAHKIPKFVVMASALPKTASGKVRRVELERGELT